nr:MAG TPA: hypothetical protein [Caudoviricetes sp.]
MSTIYCVFCVVYSAKLSFFVFIYRTLCLFCYFCVSLAYESLVFSTVIGCYNALKMSVLIYFCSK